MPILWGVLLRFLGTSLAENVDQDYPKRPYWGKSSFWAYARGRICQLHVKARELPYWPELKTSVLPLRHFCGPPSYGMDKKHPLKSKKYPP